MIGTTQPKVLGDFYKKIFGDKPDMEDGETAYGWSLGGTYFTIGEHSEVKGDNKEPARCIINLETNEIEAEYERIKGLGAEVVKELYEMEGAGGMKIATFADPDGNYFQLMSPWEGENE